MDPQVETLRSLFDDFGTWALIQVGLIVAASVALYQAVKWALPRAAELLPTRFRIMALNAIPLVRLALALITLALVVPIVFNVTFRNVVLVMSTIGVALGFALKDFATSAFAGVVAVLERPYRTGDWVRVGEDYGEVIEIGTRAFKLRTPDDDVVTIPHARIWDHNIANGNNGASTLMVAADFLVAPESAAVPVEQLLTDVALTSPYLHWDQPIRVVSSTSPEGTNIKLRAYPFELRDQFAFATDLDRRGRAALTEAGAKLVRAMGAA